MQKFLFFASIILMFFVIEISISSAQTIQDTTKRKHHTTTVVDNSELSTIWNIFYKGGGLGVAFLFCIYAYFEMRSMKKQNLALQNQLIESYSKAFVSLIDEYKQQNIQNLKFLKIIANFLKPKKDANL